MAMLPGSPFPTGAGTFCIKASPGGKFVYVAPGQGLGSRVSRHQKKCPQLITFSVQRDGALQQVGEPLKLPEGSTPVTMAITADGRNLYLGIGVWRAGFFNGAVAHFRLDIAGRPQMMGEPIRLGRKIDGAAQPIISRDGKFLYVASVIAKAVVRLDIQEDGSLSEPKQRTRSSGIFPITPAFSADGQTLYICNEQSKSITAFRVGADGSLSELPSSPYPTGRIPHNPVVSKDGRFIYFANTLSDNITCYEIQFDGSLVPLPGSPIRSPVGPAMLCVSSDGKWLYLISSPIFRRDKSVVVTSWRIQSDGKLERSKHPPAQTGLQFADGPSAVVLPVEA